jgi:hypothetical protein
MRQYPGAADAPARGGFDLSTRERSEPVGVCSGGKFSRVPRTDFTGLERGRRRTRQGQISHSALRLASLAAEASEPKGLFSALAGGRFMKPWIARSTPYEETRLFCRTGFRSSTLFRNYDPAV